MEDFNPKNLKKLYIPPKNSHKGQNGKLMVISGSMLFHSASLWALTAASRIVDMLYFSSVSTNNKIVFEDKNKFRNGIVIDREKLENYIKEADCILIGPGLPREEGIEKGDDDTKNLTENLLSKYKDKKWVVDGGSLQVISPSILPKTAIVTPNKKEFEMLFSVLPTAENAKKMAEKFDITILLKGESDFVANKSIIVEIKGGNQGMTKGGTGDVLAGLTASFYCKNDSFLSSTSASFFNKKAGDALLEKMGLFYNASDLVEELPKVMKYFIG